MVEKGLKEGYAVFFTDEPQKKYQRWLIRVWFVLLFLGGLYVWGNFFKWGNFPLNFHDWAEVSGPRLAFQQDAITKGLLPLHISDASTLHDTTNRYMSIPDLIFSPQTYLLLFLNIQQFAMAHIWIMYSLGYLGLLWLRKKIKLSLFSFTLLFLLFNFNGHIISHLSIGHLTWGGYFLLSWFVGLILDFVKGKGGWLWTLKISGLLLIIFLQGSYHQWVWALMFLGLLAIVYYQRFWQLIAAGTASVALSLVRILPAALNYDNLNNNLDFIGGFPQSQHILDNLIYTSIPGDLTLYSGFLTSALGKWEFTYYIGLVGTVFLFVFGVYRALKYNPQRLLLLPVAAMTLLSIGKIYKSFLFIPVPILAGERVCSRFFSLAFVFLLVLAVIELQRWLNTHPQPLMTIWLSSISLTFIAIDLWANYRLWLINQVANLMVNEQMDFTPTQWFVVNNYADKPYLQSLWLGLFLTILSAAVLVYFSYKETKNKTP